MSDHTENLNKMYKVRLLQNDIYQVVYIQEDEHKWDMGVKVEHQGSLPECEAYIRLHEGGYV